MRKRESTIQTLEASEARQQWSELLDTVLRRRTRVIVEKSGIPVAALISVEDLERFNRLEAQRAERFKILDRIGEVFKDETPEESERLAAQAVAEAREAHRGDQPAAQKA